MQILVVDDDQGIRETLRFACEDAQHTVAEAPDGEAALIAMRASTTPQVVLLDLMMPRMSGDKVINVVSQEPDLLKRNAFIMMTASHRTFALPFVNLLSSLKIAVLTKPIDIDVLLDHIDRASRHLR